MSLIYSRSTPLTLHEISIETDAARGEYIRKETGNTAKFRILSDGPVGTGASCCTYEAQRINAVSGRLRLKQCISTEHAAQQRFLRTALIQQKFLHTETVNATAGLLGVYRGEDGHLWAAQDYHDAQCYAEVEEPSLHAALLHLRYFAQAIRSYHDEGWLLLDISPSNLSVFREESGISGVCLFDFDSMLTPAEIQQGHPLSASCRYAAPEVLQADRRRIDCRTDIYALGVVFFEKLLGRIPNLMTETRSFSQYDLANGAHPHLTASLSPAVEDALTDFFRHTIASSPTRRYANMRDVLEAIDHLLQLTAPAGIRTPCLTRQNIQPTSNFQGQEALLRTVHQTFEVGKNRAVILCGAGGVGKSELARQYAALHHDDYTGINFLVCTPEDTDWRALTDRLEFVSGEASGLDGHNLIILDNFDCEDPAMMRTLLMDLLERTGEARILVTTRSCRLPALPRCAELPLHEDAALAFSVFCTNYTKPLRAEDEETVRAILKAVDHNTFAADMIARELSARPELTPARFWERMEVLGVSHALPADVEVSTGKDKDYAPATFTRQVEKLFADVLSHDFTPQQMLVLSLLIHAPARYFSRLNICRMVGDHGDTALADQAVEQLLRRNWVRQQMVDEYAAIGVHPLAAEALLEKLTVSGEMVRTLIVNLLTLTDIDADVFRELYHLIFAHRSNWCTEIIEHCATETQRREEQLRNTMIQKALNARLTSRSLPIWLDYYSLGSDPGSGFGISAVSGNGESARYFCYLEDADLSLQYLEIAHRDYVLRPDQLCTQIREVSPAEDDTISLLHVATGDAGDQTFDLSVMIRGTPEQHRSLHSESYCPRRKRVHRVYLEASNAFCRISPKGFRGGFPTVPVTRIAARAFLLLEELRHVALPDTVRVIEHDAFRYSGLTELVLPAAKAGITIAEDAFSNCDALASVTLPEGLTSIPRFAFSDCSALVELSLPSSLVYLGHDAFARTGLRTLTLPDGLAVIGMGAFRETPLETVRLPDSVQIIEPYAFSCCKHLNDVRLGNGVIRIGSGAFCFCASLPYLRLPDSLQFVDPVAFDNCTALTTLSLPAHVEFSGLALENCPLETVLLRGTPSPSVWQQFASNPPRSILFPMNGVHCMRFLYHQNAYIPDPRVISVDLDIL